jgi:hypothetical protein
MNTYTFREFDYTDKYIYILKNTIFYRGVPDNINKTDIIRDKPIYLAPENIAKMYGKVYKIGCIETLRLLDILDNIRFDYK